MICIMKKRIIVFFSLVMIVFVLILGKLGYMQFFQASELKNSALDSRLRQVELKGNRGTIYDAKGSALAVSIPCDTVYINPNEIRKADQQEGKKRQKREAVVADLATILEIDPDELDKKIDKESSFTYVKRKMTDEQSEQIRKLKYRGVYFLEETKRSYPKGSLAGQVIGFSGMDNQGLSGLEMKYDSTLLGRPGQLLIEYDGAGNEIPNGYKAVVPSIPGNDIYLTLDETIQYIIERELKQVVAQENAKGATAIVMDVKTAAVLGMANYPDYDPNKPGEVDQNLWKNFAVNGLYEPGSTFKIMTTAMGLEDRVTSAQEPFYCAGYQMIGDMRMNCHRKSGHGAESFTQGVANSCNPVFVEVSRRLGVNRFYDYLKGFGMTQKTGIDLPGEAGSLMVPERSVMPFDLAAMSIGQTNAYTPIQMITAISAVANGGRLMKPHIVDEIKNFDGELVKKTEPEVVRQVISEETAREVWAILENVVSNGTGKKGKVEGYKVCGKTGTAEKVGRGGGYSEHDRVVSFAGFAPADNPQIACIVIVDTPAGGGGGGSTAGPVFSRIMGDVLRYMNVPKNISIAEPAPVEEVEVPKLSDKDPYNAIAAIQAAGLTPFVETQGEVVYTYIPAPGTKVPKGGNVYLYCGPANGDQISMPALYGKTIKEADRVLTGMGIPATMKGSGVCVSQSIEPGTPIKKGTPVTVNFGVNSVDAKKDSPPEAGDPSQTENEKAPPNKEEEPLWD